MLGTTVSTVQGGRAVQNNGICRCLASDTFLGVFRLHVVVQHGILVSVMQQVGLGWWPPSLTW